MHDFQQQEPNISDLVMKEVCPNTQKYTLSSWIYWIIVHGQ